jgi:hypothetical protein
VLDQISRDYDGWVAPVEWHTVSSYPLYNAEGNAKWHLYPPPYQGGYATPWIWVDGKSRGYIYNQWAGYVSNQILVPTDVSMAHVGTWYNPSTRAGEVAVECYNGGTTQIDAALQFAITEDSLHYTGPNGDPIHNHVCRDYVPNQNGTPVTLGAGMTDTITVAYSLQPSWVEENIRLVVYLQNMTTQPDSSKPCLQSKATHVLDFTGVEEQKLLQSRDLSVQVSPNPCRTGCRFAISGAAAREGSVTIYTPDGRLVSRLATERGQATWNRTEATPRGIYLYRVNAGTATSEGKLVVTD